LHLPGELHFLRRAAFRLDTFGDLLTHANAFQRNSGLTGDGGEQLFVFPRIRLFGEPRA